jgi:transcriptional regulator with XRE-family HTH domain
MHITNLRLAAGLTQTALAEIIHEPQSSIARWETSDRPPRADVAAKLANALGVSVDDVLNISKKPGKPGPKGKVARALEEVSKLPPRQQDQVLQVVNALLLQFKQQAA